MLESVGRLAILFGNLFNLLSFWRRLTHKTSSRHFNVHEELLT